MLLGVRGRSERGRSSARVHVRVLHPDKIPRLLFFSAPRIHTVRCLQSRYSMDLVPGGELIIDPHPPADVMVPGHNYLLCVSYSQRCRQRDDVVVTAAMGRGPGAALCVHSGRYAFEVASTTSSLTGRHLWDRGV